MNCQPKKIGGVLHAPVVFARRCDPYNPGETAWFPIGVATDLIRRGLAVRPDAGKPASDFAPTIELEAAPEAGPDTAPVTSARGRRRRG